MDFPVKQWRTIRNHSFSINKRLMPFLCAGMVLLLSGANLDSQESMLSDIYVSAPVAGGTYPASGYASYTAYGNGHVDLVVNTVHLCQGYKLRVVLGINGSEVANFDVPAGTVWYLYDFWPHSSGTGVGIGTYVIPTSNPWCSKNPNWARVRYT